MVDTSIILGYKSPEVLSSDERALNQAKVQDANANNQINQLKIKEYLNKSANQDKLQQFLQANPKATSADLASQGYYDQAKDLGGIETSNQANQAAQLKMTHDKLDLWSQASGYVAQNPTIQNAHNAIDGLAQNGFFKTPQELQAAHDSVPADEIQIQPWAQQHFQQGLAAKEQLPKIGNIDNGGTQQFYSQSPVTGQASITGTLNKTQSPDNIANNLRTSTEGGLNRQNALNIAGMKQDTGAPVSVMGADGKAVFVNRNDAIGKQPYNSSARQIPASINTAIVNNNQSLSKLDAAIALLEGKDVGTSDSKMLGDKEATGWKGLLPPIALNRIDPKGVDARAAVADIGSLILHDRSGAAVTASESPRLMPFIPSSTDDNATVLKKLKRLREYQATENDLLSSQYSEDAGYKGGISTQPNQAKPAPTQAAKQVVKTGTHNGKKVVQYSDGTISYAQ